MKPTLYRQLAHSLAEDIEQGRYAPDSKVPSIRDLSARENVSISTVTKAYSILEDEGYIRSRPQSGYFVREQPEQISPPVSKGDKPRIVSKLDLITKLLEQGNNKQFINLGSAIPDASFMPLAALQKHTQKVLRFDRDKAFSIGLSPGSLALRQLISRRVLDASVRCHADDILLTTGATEAISHCLRAVTKPGDIVAIESPCYYGFLQIANTLNLKVIEIPTDVNVGMSYDAMKLATQQWDIKAILLSTRFSNPTGALMPDETKSKLYELSVSKMIPIIEDDVYGDLGHRSSGRSVMKHLDRQGLVMYCSSFSKTISPGLRLGWCIPGKYYEQVRQYQIASSWSVSGLTQLAVESYLSHANHDKHIRKLNATFEENIRRATSLLKSKLPGSASMSAPSGSFLLWLCLPKGINIAAVHRTAVNYGINLAPGSLFSNTDQFDHCLRLNCALPWKEKLEPGLHKLLTCIELSS